MIDDELLTLPEIAHTLGMNPSTVRLWVREGRLRAEKVGRKWMVRRADLEQMLAATDVVVFASGAEAVMGKLQTGVPAIEYRHAPDAAEIERVLVPLIRGPGSTSSDERKAS